MIQNITPVKEEKVVIFDSCSSSREFALENSDAVSSFPFPLISFFFVSDKNRGISSTTRGIYWYLKKRSGDIPYADARLGLLMFSLSERQTTAIIYQSVHDYSCTKVTEQILVLRILINTT